MPKLFPIHIKVEEIALGSVMRLLHRTPGVADVDLDLDEPKKKTNGAHYKPRGTFEVSGTYAIEELLYAKPHTAKQLQAAFEKQGRSPASVASAIHEMKESGDVAISEDGYVLSRRAKDRVRHRKAAKKGGK